MGDPFCDLGIVTPCIAESFCKKSHLKTLKELRHDRPLSVRFLNGNYPFPNPWDQDASAFGYLRLCIIRLQNTIPFFVFQIRWPNPMPKFGSVLFNCGIYLALLLLCCLAVSRTPIKKCACSWRYLCQIEQQTIYINSCFMKRDCALFSRHMIYKYYKKSSERVVYLRNSMWRFFHRWGGVFESTPFLLVFNWKIPKNTGSQNNFGTFLWKSIDIWQKFVY